MVCRDEYKIEAFDDGLIPSNGLLPSELRVLASRFDNRHIRIVVLCFCAAFAEQVHQDVTGRFAVIVDIRLVCQSEDENFGATNRFLLGIERISHAMYHMLRHLGVDLASQFNETRMFTVLARLPCEIERIDRDAVTAQTRTWIEGHEAKRLGFRRFDDFPDVNSHGGVNDL